MMFDPALAAAVSYAFSQSRPDTIQPSITPLDMSGFERSLDRLAKTARQTFAAWQAAGLAAREGVVQAVHNEPRPSPKLAERLNQIVEQIEAELADLSDDIRSSQLRAERRWKRLAKLYPHMAKPLRQAQAIEFDLGKQEMEDRSDFALFLRSVRAEFDPDAQGGKTFDSDGDLSKYLDSLLA